MELNSVQASVGTETETSNTFRRKSFVCSTLIAHPLFDLPPYLKRLGSEREFAFG